MTDIVKILRVMNEEGVNHVGHAADEIETLRRELAAEIEERREGNRLSSEEARQEIESLTREKDHYIEQWSNVCDENQGLRNDLTESKANDLFAMKLLAEARAREKVYIEALKKIALRPWHSQVRAFADAALAQPADDSALKAALETERERCASVCLDIVDGQQYAEAIRALGE